MNLKRIIGILVAIAGVAMICVSYYIQNQVESGKVELASGEKKVNQGKSLFGLNPYTKEVGNKVIFNSADQKISAGKEEIAYYETLEQRFWIGGLIAIGVGIAIMLIPFGRNKRT